MKFAFVHEWLVAYAGSEKVVEGALELWPGHTVHTLVHDPAPFVDTLFARHPIKTSFLQHMPLSPKRFRAYLPLFPTAIEQLEVGEVDVVFSSNHTVGKGVLTRSDQLHICYVHTPARFLWDLYFDHMRETGLDRGIQSVLFRGLLHYLRTWDVMAAERVDVFVANSQYVARRINKVYRRQARVIHPPVETQNFDPHRSREDFFLVVGRLVPYKRVDLIVEAFNRLGLPLVIVGDGPELGRLRKVAKTNIRFEGYQSDAVVRRYMETCRAFVFAAEEDFGITPVEAQAAGAPVIAFGRGGLLETIVDGRTGLFFPRQEASSIEEAVRRFVATSTRFEAGEAAAQAEQFSRARFLRELKAFVEEAAFRFHRDGPLAQWDLASRESRPTNVATLRPRRSAIGSRAARMLRIP